MQPIPPFWFLQRQAKMEPAGENTFRVTAPNLREHFIAIRQGADGNWLAALRTATDGPDIAATHAMFDKSTNAWIAAFELYRTQIVV